MEKTYQCFEGPNCNTKGCQWYPEGEKKLCDDTRFTAETGPKKKGNKKDKRRGLFAAGKQLAEKAKDEIKVFYKKRKGNAGDSKTQGEAKPEA